MKQKKVYKLRKNNFLAAKVSAKKANLIGVEKILELSELSFEEIIKFLEENGFKESIDINYLEFEGFYLIEKILNNHLTKIYSTILRRTHVKNQKLFDLYYLKYQIHNILVVLRCKKTGEKEISPYLLGENLKQEKYLKAFEMPFEDGLIYMLKKIGVDVKTALKKYEEGDLFELENYLYNVYYKNLISTVFVYNKKDENIFLKYIKSYVDLINFRTLIKLKVEGNEKLVFENLFISGGTFKIQFYKNLNSLNIVDILKEVKKIYPLTQTSDPSSVDRLIVDFENSSKKFFKNVPFGSPFYILTFLFQVERELDMIRVLLKAKYLKLPSDEIKNFFKN